MDKSASMSGRPSRGYIKLDNILKFLRYDCHHKVALDIGSSTGGFTACLLDHGADKVIAVEKGTHQMSSPLRFDPRIDLREKTDIFSLSRSDLSPIDSSHSTRAHADSSSSLVQSIHISSDQPRLDLIVADVSFISLRPVLSYARDNLAIKGTEFLVMLKPQFEAKESDLNRGVIKNEKIRRHIIKDFEYWLRQNGFFIVAKHDNPLPGKSGNLERFYLLTSTKRSS